MDESPDVLMELASEICKNRDLHYGHPKVLNSSIRLDSIDIWHADREEYIRLHLNENSVTAEIYDENNHCEYEENYQFNTFDPDKIKEDCFSVMAEILKQEFRLAERIVKGTKAFLKEIEINELEK